MEEQTLEKGIVAAKEARPAVQIQGVRSEISQVRHRKNDNGRNKPN
jgi:hypothetical protein